MGVYDSVLVKCQKCNEELEFQSKSGECSLRVYDLENCPNDVLQDVNRHSPMRCYCGVVYKVDIATRKPIELNDF